MASGRHLPRPHGCPNGAPDPGDSIPPNSGDQPPLQIARRAQSPCQTVPVPNSKASDTNAPRPGSGCRMALAGCSWLFLGGEQEGIPIISVAQGAPGQGG